MSVLSNTLPLLLRRPTYLTNTQRIPPNTAVTVTVAARASLAHVAHPRLLCYSSSHKLAATAIPALHTASFLSLHTQPTAYPCPPTHLPTVTALPPESLPAAPTHANPTPQTHLTLTVLPPFASFPCGSPILTLWISKPLSNTRALFLPLAAGCAAGLPAAAAAGSRHREHTASRPQRRDGTEFSVSVTQLWRQGFAGVVLCHTCAGANCCRIFCWRSAGAQQLRGTCQQERPAHQPVMSHMPSASPGVLFGVFSSCVCFFCCCCCLSAGVFCWACCCCCLPAGVFCCCCCLGVCCCCFLSAGASCCCFCCAASACFFAAAPPASGAGRAAAAALRFLPSYSNKQTQHVRCPTVTLRFSSRHSNP